MLVYVKNLQPIAVPPGKQTVTVYDRNGKAISMFSLDAREALATGEYSLEPTPPIQPNTPLVPDIATDPAGAVADATRGKRGGKG